MEDRRRDGEWRGQGAHSFSVAVLIRLLLVCVFYQARARESELGGRRGGGEGVRGVEGREMECFGMTCQAWTVSQVLGFRHRVEGLGG